MPELHQEEQLSPVIRYRLDDKVESKAVYIFDHKNGKLVLGDPYMADYVVDMDIASLMD